MTISSDGSTAKLYSTLLDALIAEDPVVSTLIIKQTNSCGTTTTTTIEQGDISTEDNCGTDVYYYEVESIPSGPIYWVLAKTTSGTETTDTLCYVNLCDVDRCDVLDLFFAGNKTAFLYYEALQAAEQCDKCTCDELCTIYTALTDLLDDC